jgi:hypothetical protein
VVEVEKKTDALKMKVSRTQKRLVVSSNRVTVQHDEENWLISGMSACKTVFASRIKTYLSNCLPAMPAGVY